MGKIKATTIQDTRHKRQPSERTLVKRAKAEAMAQREAFDDKVRDLAGDNVHFTAPRHWAERIADHLIEDGADIAKPERLTREDIVGELEHFGWYIEDDATEDDE